MIKEKYINRVKEISLNVVQTEVESVRKKDILKTGLRVYDKGYIGIAGGLGRVDEEELERRAIDNLSLKVPYPYNPSKELKKEVDYREDVLSDEDFVNEIDELLNILKDEFPDFTFSNKINITEVETRLVNSMGLDLGYKDRLVLGQLIIKEKASANVFDALALYIERQYRRELFLNIIRETLRLIEIRLSFLRRANYPSYL